MRLINVIGHSRCVSSYQQVGAAGGVVGGTFSDS